MDPASFAFSAISLFQTLLSAYKVAHRVAKDLRGFSDERERFISRVDAEHTITASLRELLLTRRSPSQDFLFDELDLRTRQSLIALLNQFQKAILEYDPLEKEYQLDQGPSTVPTGLLLSSAPMTNMTVNDEDFNPRLSFAEASRDKLRKIKWAIGDKKKAWDLLKEFELWNKKMVQLVELQLLQRARDSQFSEGYTFRGSSSQTLGITNAVEAQRVARVNPSLPGHTNLESYMLPWNELEITWEDGAFKLGRFRGGEVIIDTKDMEDAIEGQQALQGSNAQRLDQLAKIIQTLADDQIGLPKCIGWAERRTFGEWLMLFEKPAGLDNPKSLLSQLNTDQRAKGPPLEERFRLAYRICSTMSRLWSIGWIHKNLRSSNIIWMEDKDESEPEAWKRGRGPKYMVLGFEFARDVETFSDGRPDYKIERNVYRHPNRQRKPTERFRIIHDIYALGVLLLEIGLWRQVLSLGKRALTEQMEPGDVRSYLVKRAQDHLPYLTGSDYCDAVLACLTSQFGLCSTDGLGRDDRLVTRFRRIVEDELRQLAFPHLAAGRYPTL